MFFAIIFIAIGVAILLDVMGVLSGGFWGIFWGIIFIAVGIKLLKKEGCSCKWCDWGKWREKLAEKIEGKVDRKEKK